MKQRKPMKPPHRRGDAIALFCWQCLGDETHPRECESTECPLYRWRPGTTGPQIRDMHGSFYVWKGGVA